MGVMANAHGIEPCIAGGEFGQSPVDLDQELQGLPWSW